MEGWLTHLLLQEARVRADPLDDDDPRGPISSGSHLQQRASRLEREKERERRAPLAGRGDWETFGQAPPASPSAEVDPSKAMSSCWFPTKEELPRCRPIPTGATESRASTLSFYTGRLSKTGAIANREGETRGGRGSREAYAGGRSPDGGGQTSAPTDDVRRARHPGRPPRNERGRTKDGTMRNAENADTERPRPEGETLIEMKRSAGHAALQALETVATGAEYGVRLVRRQGSCRASRREGEGRAQAEGLDNRSFRPESIDRTERGAAPLRLRRHALERARNDHRRRGDLPRRRPRRCVYGSRCHHP